MLAYQKIWYIVLISIIFTELQQAKSQLVSGDMDVQHDSRVKYNSKIDLAFPLIKSREGYAQRGFPWYQIVAFTPSYLSLVGR